MKLPKLIWINDVEEIWMVEDDDTKNLWGFKLEFRQTKYYLELLDSQKKGTSE